MAFIADYIFDLALAEFDTNADTLYICSQEPTSYAAASSTYRLGTKSSLSVGAPADRSPSGRRVTVAAFSDGAVNAGGTATHWAICKGGTTLMATGALASSQAVVAGNTFSLAAFDVGIPDAA